MKNFENMRLGDRLNYMLENRGLTQVDLGKKIGITQAAISNIVRERAKSPSSTTLLKLAGALQCSPEWLMHGTGDPDQSNTLGEVNEQELIELFRRLPEQAKPTIVAMIRSLMKS